MIISYAEPNRIEVGFAMGQPVLDVLIDGKYAGCLFRSYRNSGHRLIETYQLHLHGGRPRGPKFEMLEDLILWTQESLMGKEESCDVVNS